MSRFTSATKFAGAALVAAALSGAATGAHAQESWPPDEITLVISHSVGSSQNQTTRVFGDVLQEHLGTKFVYDNRSGASGRVGYDYFMSLPKDGSYLLSSNQASASIMYAQQNPDWDWRESLLPVSVFTVDPGVIFVRKDSEYDSLQELIEASKEEPLTMAISFWASPENLQIHQIMEATGAKFEIIPIDSSTELVTQVLGGHIDFGYTKALAVQRAGDTMRVVGVPLANNPIPDITSNAPTVDEALGTETIGIASYRAILAHKEWADANPEHVEKLREAIAKTIEDPRYIEQMEKLGVDSGLLVNMSTDEIYEQVLDRYWNAFDKFGQIYEQN